MDKALGRLFNFLKSEGLDENTLVVFTSDNGPGPLTPQVISESVVERYHERPDLLNSVGSARIYKERKISLHDGGIRVPFIISWPGTVPQGIVDKTSVIHGTDCLPTLASICGVVLPEANYDGTDAKAAFMGHELDRAKDIYWTQGGSVACLRDQWKGILSKSDEFEMYDIEKDPEELNDLVTVHPDMAENFKQEILAWKKELALLK